METVIKLSTSRNNQKVKNEVVTTITKGMAKVIYDYLDGHQNEESTTKSRNALTGFFFFQQMWVLQEGNLNVKISLLEKVEVGM